MPSPRDVRLSRRAERVLASIEAAHKDRLKRAVRELSVNPLLGKKLKGELEALRSMRMGSFRFVYRFTKALLEIVYIDHRKDVYR
jgi:mRNA-degrading endonuclease RelE of RelBE toxin-antitoxin system